MKEQTDGRTAYIITIIFLLLVILLGGYLFITRKPVEQTVEGPSIYNIAVDTTTENLDEGNKELSERQVFFSGQTGGSFTSTQPMLLRNSASNQDIYMQYVVKDDATGEVLIETDLIPSGRAIEWIPGESLKEGEYNLTLTEKPFYQVKGTDRWMPLTTGNDHVTITITN